MLPKAAVLALVLLLTAPARPAKLYGEDPTLAEFGRAGDRGDWLALPSAGATAPNAEPPEAEPEPEPDAGDEGAGTREEALLIAAEAAGNEAAAAGGDGDAAAAAADLIEGDGALDCAESDVAGAADLGLLLVEFGAEVREAAGAGGRGKETEVPTAGAFG